MYSLILMTAVASSGDSSTFHFHRGSCHGCGGAVVVVQPAPVTYTLGCYGTPHYVVGGHGFHRGSGGCCGGCWSSWNASFYSGSSCCGGCCGGGYMAIPTVVDCCGPVSIATPAVPAATVEKPTGKAGVANIKIELPENAQLYVDGQLVPGTGAVRQFTTPTLPGGQAFAYVMTADVVIDGSKVHEEVKVVVHSQDSVEKSFGQLLAAARRSKPTELAKK